MKRRTNQTEQHWKKNQPMKGTDDDDAEVHSKVKNLEYFGWRKCENDDTKELCQCDAGENGAAHLCQALLGTSHIGVLL